MDVPRIHRGSCKWIFKSIPTWKVFHLLFVSRASSWGLRGRMRFLIGVLVVFDIMAVHRIHRGGCVSNFQISTYLESAPSPMCLQWIIMESKRMQEVPERSLGGFWHNGCPKDTTRKLHINFQISTILECLNYICLLLWHNVLDCGTMS